MEGARRRDGDHTSEPAHAGLDDQQTPGVPLVLPVRTGPHGLGGNTPPADTRSSSSNVSSQHSRVGSRSLSAAFTVSLVMIVLLRAGLGLGSGPHLGRARLSAGS